MCKTRMYETTISETTSDTLSNSVTKEQKKMTLQKQVRAWYRGICIMQTCHGDFAYKYTLYDRFLKVLSVSLTAITSAVIFCSISPPGEVSAKATSDYFLAIIAGDLAILNAVVQSVHNALGLTEAKERHTVAYKQFTSMRFQLERLTAWNFEDDGSIMVDEVKLMEWTNDYGSVLESAPLIPQKKFDLVRMQEMKKEDNYFHHSGLNSRTSTHFRNFQLDPIADSPA